jgi:hypothetical protein
METEIIQLTMLTPRKPSFGEFLVQQRILDRFQLLRALQMQDRMPGARLGQCAVALGFVPHAAVEQLHVRFERIGGDALESMRTEAFHREPEIEIMYPIQ